MIFTVSSFKDERLLGEPEIFNSYRELATDLYVSAMPSYNKPVLRWAESAKDGSTFEFMNGSIREVWTATAE